MWAQQIGIVGLECKTKSFPSENRRQEASILATFEMLHLKMTNIWSIFEFCYQKIV